MVLTLVLLFLSVTSVNGVGPFVILSPQAAIIAYSFLITLLICIGLESRNIRVSRAETRGSYSFNRKGIFYNSGMISDWESIVRISFSREKIDKLIRPAMTKGEVIRELPIMMSKYFVVRDLPELRERRKIGRIVIYREGFRSTGERIEIDTTPSRIYFRLISRRMRKMLRYHGRDPDL